MLAVGLRALVQGSAADRMMRDIEDAGPEVEVDHLRRMRDAEVTVEQPLRAVVTRVVRRPVDAYDSFRLGHERAEHLDRALDLVGQFRGEQPGAVRLSLL